MGMSNVVLVFFGGALGAVTRYFMARWVEQQTNATLPLGTLVVNLLGCFFIGWLHGTLLPVPHRVELILSTGFVGAFTTFSTLSYETLRLLEEGSFTEAFWNPVLSVLLGLFFVALGDAVGRVLT
jgi:CrcB protein